MGLFCVQTYVFCVWTGISMSQETIPTWVKRQFPHVHTQKRHIYTQKRPIHTQKRPFNSHVNESWDNLHIYMSHVIHGATLRESCPTYEWVISQIRMSHESCPTYDCVIHGATLRSHVRRTNESWFMCPYKWVSNSVKPVQMSHNAYVGHRVQRSSTNMSHILQRGTWITTHSNASCHTWCNASGALSYTRIRYQSHSATLQESCPTYEWVVNHVPHMKVWFHTRCNA